MISIVNNIPGSGEALDPAQSFQFGLKSSSSSVELGTLTAFVALSNIISHAANPLTDAVLESLGVKAGFNTPENQLPITHTLVPTIDGFGDVVLTKPAVGAGDGDVSIFSLQNDINPGASVLGYWKIKKSNAWSSFTPDWCTVAVAPPYFGLEHGEFNTALYVFLSTASSGQLVIGGPLQEFNQSRPNQVTVSLPWPALSDGDTIEVIILFDRVGLPTPYSSPLVPVVQVYTRLQGATEFTLQFTTVVGAIGTFPSLESGWLNYRLGPSETTTLFFGNGGRDNDVVTIVDFGLYPDYRKTIQLGQALTNAQAIYNPDTPIIYEANGNKTPDELPVGPWFPIGVQPQSTLYYQPGNSKNATYLTIPKTAADGALGYKKQEPRLTTRINGASIEGSFSLTELITSNASSGVGLSIDDGSRLIQALCVTDPTGQTFIGIVKDVAQLGSSSFGYYLPSTPTDFTTIKRVRLVLDRQRTIVELFVEDFDNPILTVSYSDQTVFPVSSGIANFSFGHLYDLTTSGSMHVEDIQYEVRYSAYESTDLTLPDSSVLHFVPTITGSASPTFDANNLLTLTNAYDPTSGTQLLYKLPGLDTAIGFQLDFQLQIASYSDDFGRPNASKTTSNVQLIIDAGDFLIQLYFTDAGIYGKKIGIMTSSITDQDVINGGLNSGAVSTPLDWTQLTSFRIVYRPYQSLDVFILPELFTPAIHIPWISEAQQFDLPEGSGTQHLTFGASTGKQSVSKWGYLRIGQANGYEVATCPLYPDGYPSYLFDGKVFTGVYAEDASLSPAPTFISISPGSGPASGGTFVTIIGTNFQSGCSVTIGGVNQGVITFIDSGTITFTTTAGSIGVLDVVITNPDSQFVDAGDVWTYTTSVPGFGVSRWGVD